VSGEQGAPRRAPLCSDQPLPPEDRYTDCDWRSDVEYLYRERAGRLIGHFTSATLDSDAASEIVHEAFARFTGLAFARRLRIGRPDAYLYRICLNLVRDLARSPGSRTRELAQLDDEVSYNPLVELEHRDTLRRLEKAMLRLAPKTREIFLAKRLDGMSYAEIAERTGLSIKGVEKHMGKAIAAIDRAMNLERR
jgi:RNA polymerase sigma-70 factor (ECF subfamily)